MPPAVIPPKKKAPAAAAARPSSPLNWFRRLQIGFGVIVQLIIITAIVFMINAYAYKHYRRFDYSRDHKYALSQRTRQFLASLTKPVKVIVFMNGRSPLVGDVGNLVQEYRAAQPKFLQIEQVDPYRNVPRATEIQAKYKLNDQESVVIVDAGERAKPADTAPGAKPADAGQGAKPADAAPGAKVEHFKVIRDIQMADIDQGNEMLQQEPKITAFKGEQAITGGLIEVTQDKKNLIYYVRGHGAPLATDANGSLAALAKIIADEQVGLQELNLLNSGGVPADASALFLIGPETDLSEGEIKLLDDYWTKGGRMFVLLDPDRSTPRLNEFLSRLGVAPDDDRLMAYVSMGGQPRLFRQAVVEFTAGSPINAQLQNVDCALLGSTQTLTLRTPEEVAGLGLKLTPLMVAKKGFWGEMDYKNIDDDNPPKPDGADKRDPLVVAASVEKGAVSDQRVQAPSSRLTVMGNSRWIQPDALGDANYSFLLSNVNWLLAREALTGGIPPKQVKTFTLNLTDSQEGTLFWIVILAMPGFFALLGVGVWWTRRA